MTALELLSILLTALVLGQSYYIWLAGRRRPAWWRRLDLHAAERLIMERFDSQANHLTKVVAGLHEDIDGLRQEIRALAALPPETQVPRLIYEVRALRLGATIIGAALIALAVYVWLSLGAPVWAWAGA